MYTSVTMNLTDEEIQIVDYLRKTLQLHARTDAVGEALRIARLVAEEIACGHEVAILDPATGQPLSLLALPSFHLPPLQ